MVAGPFSGIPLIGSALSGFRDEGIFGRAKKAIASAGQLFEGPKENEAEAVEWYFDRITRVMQGLDAFTGVVHCAFGLSRSRSGWRSIREASLFWHR